MNFVKDQALSHGQRVLSLLSSLSSLTEDQLPHYHERRYKGMIKSFWKSLLCVTLYNIQT